MASLSETPEWELRTYCDRTGIWCSWRQLADLFREVERVPYRNRAAWIDEQEQILDRMNLGVGHRTIAKALAAGADTAVGKAIAEHDVRFSASLAYWLSRSVVPAQE